MQVARESEMSIKNSFRISFAKVILRCILHLCGESMRPKKRDKTRQFTVRLSESDAVQFQDLKKDLRLESNSDAMEFLLAKARANVDAQEDMMYSLVDRLAQHIERRFQSLNTIAQLHLAVTDAFIKYAVSALPHLPDDLKELARLRGMDVYQNINIAAVKEFQRRRQSNAYVPEKLGLETNESETT